MTEKKMQLVDWLDDLCVRFIINLPKEELESVERICFQVEEAQWFYEDFIRPLDPDMPSLNLRNFCLLIFQHCPMFSSYSSYHHAQAFSEFLVYKTRVPVRGAIMLNEKMDEVVLVKGWKKGANWSFPRGKINKDEPDLECAIREVYEETGYDIKTAGLVGNEVETKYIEMNLREQHMRLYVFRGVPMDAYFEPRTRKEISKIQWWKLSDLPTLKKKKQQQEGQGGDLPINANKSYMVAPFLPQLKKWTAEQRKLDRARQSSVSAAVPTTMAGEPIPVDDTEADEDIVLPMSNGEMERLLDTLRQSAPPKDAENIAEVTAPAAAGAEIASQLKNFLGVPSEQPETVQGAAQKPRAPEFVNNPKANSLLALLQSKPEQPVELPKTPMEQIVEGPLTPSSPRHPDNQPPRFSSMPPPPMFPLTSAQDQISAIQLQEALQPQPPQIQPIPPPQQPAQLIPRTTQLQQQKLPPRVNVNQQTRAPYQRTGDPQFAQYAQVPGQQLPSIPPANKLPAPKLNAQSSALLNLFKFGMPAKAPAANGDLQTSTASSEQVVAAAPPLNTMRNIETFPNIEHTIQAPAQEKPTQASGLTNMFVPSQVSPSTYPHKVTEVVRPKSEHHDKLLNLFRSPTTAAVESPKPATMSLQLPSAPVELSALPSTPGHSRGPSEKDQLLQDKGPLAAQNGPAQIQKRPQQNTAKPQNPPVSATINGPLNDPQFSMLARASKEAKRAVYKHGPVQPQKPSLVTILARPTSSHEKPPVPADQTSIEEAAPPKQQKVVAPKKQTFVTPAQKPPPTPDLKGAEAPPKPFHPQILRRPAHAEDELSPIQPLPSPKHALHAYRHPTQPADHRKSLLSLFTKPSQDTLPPSAASASGFDPTALISPLNGPTPQEQAEAAFARLANSVGSLSQDGRPGPRPSQPPMSRTASINAVLGEGMKSGRSSGKQTPTSRTTPVDKTFLLGYLEGVAKGGR